MTAAGGVRDAAHLRTLPDGTIISWLRIPDDKTSEAVAFVRRELDPVEGVVVWITPGGWEPHTIEGAGVTFPCQVVRFGEFNPDHYLGAELPVLTETLAECAHGGTWSREAALAASARIFQGRGFTSSGEARDMAALVTGMADVFECWLEAEPAPELPEPPAELDQAPSLGELADEWLTPLRMVGVTRSALMYAVNQVWFEDAEVGPLEESLRYAEATPPTIRGDQEGLH